MQTVLSEHGLEVRLVRFGRQDRTQFLIAWMIRAGKLGRDFFVELSDAIEIATYRANLGLARQAELNRYYRFWKGMNSL